MFGCCTFCLYMFCIYTFCHYIKHIMTKCINTKRINTEFIIIKTIEGSPAIWASIWKHPILKNIISGIQCCKRNTVRKEQFKFKLEVLIKFCAVAINMVYNLKICTFICDDKLNCIQFEQTWHSIQFNFPLYMIHSWIPILQQDGQINFHVHRTHVHRTHVRCTHRLYLLHSKVPL